MSRPLAVQPKTVEVSWNGCEGPTHYVRSDLVRALLKTYDDAAAGRLDWDEYQRAMAAVEQALLSACYG